MINLTYFSPGVKFNRGAVDNAKRKRQNSKLKESSRVREFASLITD